MHHCGDFTVNIQMNITPVKLLPCPWMHDQFRNRELVQQTEECLPFVQAGKTDSCLDGNRKRTGAVDRFKKLFECIQVKEHSGAFAFGCDRP